MLPKKCFPSADYIRPSCFCTESFVTQDKVLLGVGREPLGYFFVPPTFKKKKKKGNARSNSAIKSFSKATTSFLLLPTLLQDDRKLSVKVEESSSLQGENRAPGVVTHERKK